MGAAKWIRFAVLLSFSLLFLFIAYARREPLWLLPAAIFGMFCAITLRPGK